MNSVGPDYRVGLGNRSVVEACLDAIMTLGNADASMAEMDAFRRHCGGKHRQQIRAMKVIVRGAEEAHALVAERRPHQDAAVVPAQELERKWPHPDALERRAQSEAVQDARRVGAYLNAGPDFVQLWSLLEYLDVDPGAGKRDRRSQASDSTPDNYDSHGSPAFVIIAGGK
jgi:hypothetical protein